MNRYLRYAISLAKSPKSLVSFVNGFVRGCFYIVKFRLLRRRVIIKFPFLAHTRVEISGPGKVFIDRFCSVWINSFEHLSILTLTPDAEVLIGRNCTLGGLTIRCIGKISIGNNVLTAANLIQDVPVIVNKEQSNQGGRTEGIIVGNNVWLGGQAVLLEGAYIGDGSVVGVGGLVYMGKVDEESLVLGSPVGRPLSIPKIQRFSKKLNA